MVDTHPDQCILAHWVLAFFADNARKYGEKFESLQKAWTLVGNELKSYGMFSITSHRVFTNHV